MNKSTYHGRLIPLFIVSFFILSSTLYSGVVKANNNNQPPGTQLAYFVGYHTSNPDYYRPGYVYSVPRYFTRTVYRTKYVRPACQKTCLLDRRSGRAIRCNIHC